MYVYSNPKKKEEFCLVSYIARHDLLERDNLTVGKGVSTTHLYFCIGKTDLNVTCHIVIDGTTH